MSAIIEASARDFEEIVLKSPLPVLVDFWAPWCGPCLMMAPVLDQVAAEQAGKLKVVKVNVDDPQNIQVAQGYQIRSIPNMKLFKNGAVVREIIGARPKEMLLSEIQRDI